MHTDWINTPTNPSDFKQLADATIVSVLGGEESTAYRLLEISGADSAKFLQGQLTCNMQDITLQQSRIGSHCTHKGRMVASFRLLQNTGQSYLFSLSRETLSALQKSLGKYIVFSKAKLRDASDDYLQLGISGPLATQRIHAAFGTAPTVLHEQHIHDNGIVICVSEITPRFLCLVPAGHAKNVWQTLTAPGTTVTNCHYWHWLNICDGVGEVREQTVEEFIPQMLNMQLLDGISFTKGCYTGQEIVARMQYRGILKKGMYRIAGGGTTPSPNAAVFQDNQEQAVGHLVMAENITADQWEGLAVITHDAIEKTLSTDGSAPVTLLSLPYTVSSAE